MKITEISIYPIKSTAPIKVSEAFIENRGLQSDRRYMLVDTAARFLTAREHTSLLSIQAIPTDKGLKVNAPGMSELIVDFDLFTNSQSVTIWKSTVEAKVAPLSVNHWFTEFTGVQCCLVYMPDETRREINPEFSEPGDSVSFADGYPLLITTEKSLEDLNQRLVEPVPMERFRPNIVVDGTTAYAEDDWKTAKIGNIQFTVAKPCERCILTTIDTQTLIPHPQREPLQTLAKYRFKSGFGIVFGQNLIPRECGTIRVGDVVEVNH